MLNVKLKQNVVEHVEHAEIRTRYHLGMVIGYNYPVHMSNYKGPEAHGFLYHNQIFHVIIEKND